MIASECPLNNDTLLSGETLERNLFNTISKKKTIHSTHLIIRRHLLHHDIHHRPKIRHRIRLDIPQRECINHMNTGPQSDELHSDRLAGIRLERPVCIVSDKRASKPKRRTQLKHDSPRERPLLLDLGRTPDALPRAFHFSSLLRTLRSRIPLESRFRVVRFLSGQQTSHRRVLLDRLNTKISRAKVSSGFSSSPIRETDTNKASDPVSSTGKRAVPGMGVGGKAPFAIFCRRGSTARPVPDDKDIGCCEAGEVGAEAGLDIKPGVCKEMLVAFGAGTVMDSGDGAWTAGGLWREGESIGIVFCLAGGRGTVVLGTGVDARFDTFLVRREDRRC